MTVERKLVAPKRRSRAEVQRLVAEFVSSGMRRSEFCRSRGLSFGTLDRHLKKQRWKRRSRAVSSAGQLVPVELAAKKSPRQHEPSCGLALMARPFPSVRYLTSTRSGLRILAEGQFAPCGLTDSLMLIRSTSLVDDLKPS